MLLQRACAMGKKRAAASRAGGKASSTVEEVKDDGEDCSGDGVGGDKQRVPVAAANGEGIRDGDAIVTPGDVLMHHFFGLAAVDISTRVAAVEGIISELLAGSAPEEEEGGGGSISGDGKPRLYVETPVVKYTLRRLIRGLASGRKGARQGFALCLGELLKHITLAEPGGDAGGDPDADLAVKMMTMTVEVLDAETAGHGKNSLEKRNRALGKVFGIGSFIAAGLLPERSADGGALKSMPGTVMAVNILMGVSGERYYYREIATATILQLLRPLDPGALEVVIASSIPLENTIRCGDKAVDPVAGDEVGAENGAPKGEWSAQVSPESIWLILSLWSRLSEARIAECPIIGNGISAADEETLYTESRLELIGAHLKETARIAPRIHSVWFALVEMMMTDTGVATSPLLRKRKRKGGVDRDEDRTANGASEEDTTMTTWNSGRLRNFATAMIDNLFMGGTMALKSLGFQIVTLVLDRCTLIQVRKPFP